jgi:hypothetical protein
MAKRRKLEIKDDSSDSKPRRKKNVIESESDIHLETTDSSDIESEEISIESDEETPKKPPQKRKGRVIESESESESDDFSERSDEKKPMVNRRKRIPDSELLHLDMCKHQF